MSTRTELNATHDPQLRSWIAAANSEDSDFPIQNLPFGVFRRRGPGDAPRCGVAIGDQVLDLVAIGGMFDGPVAHAVALTYAEGALNPLMALEPEAASALRAQLSRLLRAGEAPAAQREAVAAALVPMTEAQLMLPVRVGGFTDFFASVHHATNAGRLFRPDNPLLPNYKYVPIAYNGRANSVRLAGEVRRPRGQIKGAGDERPVYRASAKLDYEVELGVYVGLPSSTDAPVTVAHAWDHVFGASLLNDWSARDIQSWEYQPLGPFLAKSFATSVSPWVVTAQALAPFRTQAFQRPALDPEPLPHLYDAADQRNGGLSIRIDARLRSARMRDRNLPPLRLSQSDSATLYWTLGQMVAHHTSNGSALDTGDLLGSGTISGDAKTALGSLLEITRGGADALALPSGETRTFLEDGDELVLTGFCERPGFVRIGFGECRATVLPAGGTM
ncbi:MAG TPA: fumarylacetoacetase [Ramlibacter sp.]|nr:fumarylacetoacetase [Ramlibacter sp.]